jgi:hypothetical protein
MKQTMKMKIYKSIRTCILLPVLFMAGCVDKFDTEPDFVPVEYGTIVPISQVKALYDDELAKPWYDRVPVQITQDWAITGIVTGSDKVNGNLYKEGYLEDEGSGILLKFLATGGFYLGDSVIINIKDLYLGDYGNFIQLGDVPYTDNSGNYRISGFNKDRRMSKVSVGNPGHPIQAGIPQVKNTAYLGRLVRFDNVQFASHELGKTYANPLSDPPAAANRELEDCDGNRIIVRSSGYATFAGDLLPEGGGTVTGIITVFNADYQLIIRDITEVDLNQDRCVSGSGELGPPVETLNEDFESSSDNVDISIEGWQNLMVAGNRVWRGKAFSGNTYAQATGYNSGLAEMETWLITPPVIISTAKKLTFRSAQAYWAHLTGNQPVEVLFSTDYNGSNLLSATWTSLPANLATQSSANYAWVNSGNVILPVQAGASGVIAFRYRGSDTESTTFIIDDVNVASAR